MQIEKRSFPNPKLNLPKEIRDADESTNRTLEPIENYLEIIAPYIYTGINLNHEAKSKRQSRAWILRSISESLLRSLYLRNAFVDSINARNLAGVYLALKAWFEVVGFLAFILEALQKGESDEDIHEKLMPLALGNKGKGNLRVGEIEAKNVLTLIESADRYITSVRKRSDTTKEGRIIDTFFSDYYDVASNPTHPSFDAHEMFGRPDGETWVAFSPDEYKRELIEQLPAYGGLLMTALFIHKICKEIFDLEGEEFKKLGVQYFV